MGFTKVWEFVQLYKKKKKKNTGTKEDKKEDL
jgi:hypothetical protein